MPRRNPNPKIDPEAPASRIAALWGNPNRFARAIGKSASTVQGWLEKGEPPLDARPDIIAAAKRDAKKLKPDHFVDHRLFKSTPAAPPVEGVPANG